MSTIRRSSGNRRDFKYSTIYLLGFLIVINYATAIDYAEERNDTIPRGTIHQTAISTRNIFKESNFRNISSNATIQDLTENLLQYGAFVRTQILEIFGKLVYDNYDDFTMSQIEALYQIYRETLERKYNIFAIIPHILKNSKNWKPAKICSEINRHVHTCLKESSEKCMKLKMHEDEKNVKKISKSFVKLIHRIYRSREMMRNYPKGFSSKAVLRHLSSGRLRLTPALFSGLLHNVRYDNFDDKVRSAEREIVMYLRKARNPRISKELEKSLIGKRSVSELLRDFLSKGAKLFDGKVADRASYLSKHVVREIDAVSENIEMLGTIYENSTINLKYLFQLILPNDVMDTDILEARNYLRDVMEKKKIMENYLEIEKYQQAGPDQLLMEILGQLRDIRFAANIVDSLYIHADYWHRSHMIKNLNELLELFDAYENLRGLKAYRFFMKIVDDIRNDLRNSPNVTIELLCSRPRECLRIGLSIVADCPLINNRTKRAIMLFLDRTTCGISEDFSRLSKEVRIKKQYDEPDEDESILKIIDDDATDIGKVVTHEKSDEQDHNHDDHDDVYSKESELVEQNNGTPESITEQLSTPSSMPEVDQNIAVENLKINSTDSTEMKDRENHSKEELQVKLETGESCENDCSSGICIGKNCTKKIGCEGDDCGVEKELEECTGSECKEKLEIKSQSNEILKEEVKKSAEIEEKVDRNAMKSDCDDSDCSETACQDDDDCDLAIFEKEDCDGLDCSICEGIGCSENEKSVEDRCQGPNCERKPSGTRYHDFTESKECQGLDCANKNSSITCEPPDCPKTKNETCENADCSKIGKKIVEKKCEGIGCSTKVNDTLKNCETNDCLNNTTMIVNVTATPCIGNNCTKESVTAIEKIEKTEKSAIPSIAISVIKHTSGLEKPKITCNNSDPHYRRKLDRLKKIRLRESSFSNSIPISSDFSYGKHQIFNKLFGESGKKMKSNNEGSSKKRVVEKSVTLRRNISNEPRVGKNLNATSIISSVSISKSKSSIQRLGNTKSNLKKIGKTQSADISGHLTGFSHSADADAKKYLSSKQYDILTHSGRHSKRRKSVKNRYKKIHDSAGLEIQDEGIGKKSVLRTIERKIGSKNLSIDAKKAELLMEMEKLLKEVEKNEESNSSGPEKMISHRRTINTVSTGNRNQLRHWLRESKNHRRKVFLENKKNVLGLMERKPLEIRKNAKFEIDGHSYNLPRHKEVIRVVHRFPMNDENLKHEMKEIYKNQVESLTGKNGALKKIILEQSKQ